MASLKYSPALSGPDTVLCLSQSSKLLASGFENGSVYIWSPDESASPICLLPSSFSCTAVAFNSSSNASILYSAFDGNIASWDLRKITDPMKIWPVSTDVINSIDPLNEQHCLAIADDTGAISLVSETDRKVCQVFNKHANICSVARFRPNWPNQLISVGLDCRLFVSDWKAGGRTMSVFEMGDLFDPEVYSELLSRSGGGVVNQLVLENREVDAESGLDDDCDGNFSESDTDNISLPGEAPGDPNDSEGVNDNAAALASLRIASSFTPQEVQEMATLRVLGRDLPFNPPMIHSMACFDSGAHVAVGLGSGTVEVFHGAKHLRHTESLFGHRRGVSALLPIGESYLVSGGNDCSLFVWGMSPGGVGTEFTHSDKINALAGHHLSKVYLADTSSKIQIVDLAHI